MIYIYWTDGTRHGSKRGKQVRLSIQRSALLPDCCCVIGRVKASDVSARVNLTRLEIHALSLSK